MAADERKTSPDVEFGTFLRLPHQSRTFSRPADSYMPSSPPSRPTSPVPASSPPPGVFLHGRPAPVTSKMRQGAPRLGGLGLGGIVESTPAPPPLPARKAPSSNRSSVPPPIPAAPIASSSGSASPASTNGRPHTPNSAKLDQKAGYPERPFLSPEMDKPTVREGAFALDRPKFEDVIKRPSDEKVEKQEIEGATTAATDDQQQLSGESEVRGTQRVEEKQQETNSGFPSPQVTEEDNGNLFDRFKTALAPEPQNVPPVPVVLNQEEEEVGSDRASINSDGDSLFATPETAAASMEEDEAIPTLALDNPTTTQEEEEEQEEIAFDGPTQLAGTETVEEEASSQVHDLAPIGQQSTQSDEVEQSRSIRDPSPPRTLAEALVSRADKSSDADGHASIPDSVATSVYNSREPSLHELLTEEDDLQPSKTDSLDPSSPTSMTHLSASSPSPARSRSPGLSEDLFPSYQQGNRHLDDPAAQYPSPPSSPATSVHTSPLPEERGLVPPSEDSSIYSVDAGTKPTASGSQHIEDVSRSVELSEPGHESNNTPVAPSAPVFATHQPDASPSSLPQRPSSESNTAPIVSPPTSPSLSSSLNSAVSPIPRRSRFSYQGLGLRMPSSIAPKLAIEEPVQTREESSPSSSKLAPSEETRSESIDAVGEERTESNEREIGEIQVPQSTNSLFPWMKHSQAQVTSFDKDAAPPPQQSDVVPGYRNDSSYPSSPSAYAPSSAAPSPEISRGPTLAPLAVPIPIPTQPVLSSVPDSAPAERTAPALIESTTSPSSDVAIGTSSIPAQSSQPPSTVEPATVSSSSAPAETKPEEGEEDPNQLSTVGVAVDIGAAVVGALAMGGLAVGQSAWKGLAVGWSAWRGASNQPVMQEAKVLEVSNVLEEDSGFKSYAKSKEVIEENEGSRKAESSVISTEWGEQEFDAPEGFLEQLKLAMAEIGEEDLAANEKAQVDAQLAAYQAASQQHVDAVASPTLSDSSSLPPASPVTLPPSRSFRQRESSARRSQPETIAEDSADEDERELEELIAPVSDSPSRRGSRIVEFPTRHGFTPPPGLTGSARSRPVSVMSASSSMGSLRSSVTQNPSAPPSPRQQPKLAKTSKSILGFGRSKSSKKLSKPAPPPPRSESMPSVSVAQPNRSQVAVSKEPKPVDDSRSQYSQTSSPKTSGRRSSIFNFGGSGKDIPPVPTIESQIKDTTYISYGSDKSKRRTSNASLPPGLYASRDPFLITPQATPAPIAPKNQYRGPPGLTGSSPRTNRSEDLGGAPLGRRKSSLRSGSAFDGSSQLTRSSSIVEGGKKLYRVRFGNAVGGIGLRQVADSEAAKAGGDRYGQRWVGVGRGRYGNMIIKTDEESELVYAEQVAQIKKKWRAFGSEQSRDWAAVKID